MHSQKHHDNMTNGRHPEYSISVAKVEFLKFLQVHYIKQVDTKWSLDQFFHFEDCRLPSENVHPLTTNHTGVKNSSYAHRHSQKKHKPRIIFKFRGSAPHHSHGPLKVRSPLEPTWLQQSHNKPRFLAATADDCT